MTGDRMQKGRTGRRRRDRLPGITILHEDADVIVIEKAAGLLVQETRHGGERTVEGMLSDHVRKGQAKSRRHVYLVHRLDRETSGVMMVAKTEAAQEHFRARWNEITEKTYLARVMGTLPATDGAFESYLAEDADGYRVRSVKDPRKGKLARTEWTKISATDRTTLVRVTLRSGRKNQIRVHFAEAGHPVVGDAKYGAPSADGGRRRAAMCLHAWRLAFIHPHTGKKMFFETALPAFARATAAGGRTAATTATDHGDDLRRSQETERP